jgi:hypothetical protein
MWGPFRRQIIASHQFYIEQARKRLLSQFQNIEEQSDKYADEWLEKAGQYFDPDRDDPGSFEEEAYDKSIEFYQMLEDMLNRTRLSIVSSIFHEWDKTLRNWMIKEIRHWHHDSAVEKALWNTNFPKIIDLLEGLSWPIKSKSYYFSIERCRLVVNSYKHGYGDSFENIKKKFPEFINLRGNNYDNSFRYVEYSDLKVDESHISEFSDAIIEFWNDVPEYIWHRDSLKVPNWFIDALVKS